MSEFLGGLVSAGVPMVCQAGMLGIINIQIAAWHCPQQSPNAELKTKYSYCKKENEASWLKPTMLTKLVHFWKFKIENGYQQQVAN